MCRVLLVSFAGYPYTPSSLMPDNGLASLAGALIEAGHEVRIVDFGTVENIRRLFPPAISRTVRPLAKKLFLEGEALGPLEKASFLISGRRLERFQAEERRRIAMDIADEAVWFGADVVGLKLWNGDGFSTSVEIARAVKEALPRAKVIAGGPHVDYFGGRILDYTGAFDLIVRGEGERVLPELVSALRRGTDWRSIPNIIWRDGAETRANPLEVLNDLDALPLPAYDRTIYPALEGDQKIRIGVLDESRGCPNRCSFCIHPIKSGGKWCVKGAERVVAEMKRLAAQLRTRFLVYSGSNTSARTAVTIAREILRQGLDVRYGCFGHVKGIARADFDLLKRSGCVAIFYGLESASPEILERAFNKRLDPVEAERVLRETKQAGICTIASVIFPAPFETEATRKATLDFLCRVRPASVPVTIPGMIPGTPWEREPERFGFKPENRPDFWEYLLTYKIKLLFPPSMWAPLPYSLNGKNSRQLFAECEEFIRELEADGIVTDLAHETVLMAEACGMRADLRQFRNMCRAMFLSGDADAIQELVYKINRAVAPVQHACPSLLAGAAP